MNCIKCGANVGNNDYCNYCGQDLRIYKKIISASSACYNLALDYAKKQDITNAIKYLKCSVLYNNKNIEAQNLLGVLYFNIGKYADAIATWIISINYDQNKNPANKYLEKIENDADSYKVINDNIIRYNNALNYLNEGAIDLSIIELKKTTKELESFVDAKLLLAILYIQKQREDRAVTLLNEVLSIDCGNKQALRLLSQITNISPSEIYNQKSKNEVKSVKNGVFFKTKRLRRETGIFYIFVGAIIAFLFTWFILTPLYRQDEINRLNETIEEYSERIEELEGN